MADHITIRKASGTYVVRTSGAIVAESAAVLELSEGDYAPVMYFPREDVAMAVLEISERQTTCPYKGEASYFSLVTPEGTIADAAWSYEAPLDGVAEIKAHLAFDGEKVTLEQI